MKEFNCRINLVTHRKLLKLTQKELANKLDMSITGYSNIENGITQKVSNKDRLLIMKQFNLSEEEFEERGIPSSIYQKESKFIANNNNSTFQSIDERFLNILDTQMNLTIENQRAILESHHNISKLLFKVMELIEKK